MTKHGIVVVEILEDYTDYKYDSKCLRKGDTHRVLSRDHHFNGLLNVETIGGYQTVCVNTKGRIKQNARVLKKGEFSWTLHNYIWINKRVKERLDNLDERVLQRNIHISEVVIGDMILHTDNTIRYVSSANIKKRVNGVTLFGDSYESGTVKVKKIICI